MVTSRLSFNTGLLLFFCMLPLTASAQWYASADLTPLSINSKATVNPIPGYSNAKLSDLSGPDHPSSDSISLSSETLINYKHLEARTFSKNRLLNLNTDLNAINTRYASLTGMHIPSPVNPVISKSSRDNSITPTDFHYVPPQKGDNESDHSFLNAFRTKPGWALLSSAVIPGSGQLINNKYLRGALYLAVEATALTIHFNQRSQALRQKKRYHRFANQHWSVVNYARWLVNYHDENGLTRASQAVDQLRTQISDIPSNDIPYGRNAWDEVTLSTLRKVERHTPYVYTNGRIGNTTFSHTLPDYGSQQYYELISKYFQFGPGWDDFGQIVETFGGGRLQNLYQLSWNKSDMPPHWHRGVVLANRFNESFRVAGNMLKLLLVNHLISAFDAFFTVKIKQHKLEANATLIRGGGSLMTLNYQF